MIVFTTAPTSDPVADAVDRLAHRGRLGVAGSSRTDASGAGHVTAFVSRGGTGSGALAAVPARGHGPTLGREHRAAVPDLCVPRDLRSRLTAARRSRWGALRHRHPARMAHDCGGIGIAMPTLVGTATAELSREDAATASAVVNTARQAGHALGIAGLVAIVGSRAGSGRRRHLQGWLDLRHGTSTHHRPRRARDPAAEQSPGPRPTDEDPAPPTRS